MADLSKMNAGELREEATRLEAEVERLEREAARRDFTVHEHVEADLAALQQIYKDRAAKCNHRKGGRIKLDENTLDPDWWAKGTDAMYAVVKHRLPGGDWIVKCLRCMCEWLHDTPGYAEALKYPTDNVSSSGVLFGVQITADTLRRLKERGIDILKFEKGL